MRIWRALVSVCMRVASARACISALIASNSASISACSFNQAQSGEDRLCFFIGSSVWFQLNPHPTFKPHVWQQVLSEYFLVGWYVKPASISWSGVGYWRGQECFSKEATWDRKCSIVLMLQVAGCFNETVVFIVGLDWIASKSWYH